MIRWGRVVVEGMARVRLRMNVARVEGRLDWILDVPRGTSFRRGIFQEGFGKSKARLAFISLKRVGVMQPLAAPAAVVGIVPVS
jgi:hypothetical protein